MQILYLTPKTDSPQDRLCRDTAELLKRYFNDNGNDYALCIMHYALNNSPAPDIVHLFGKPDAAAARCLHRAHRLHIPNIPSQHILDIATYIHVSSPLEGEIVDAIGNLPILINEESLPAFIPNPLLTRDVTIEQATSQFAQLYANVIAENDEKITRQMADRIAKTYTDSSTASPNPSEGREDANALLGWSPLPSEGSGEAVGVPDIALLVLKSQLFIARRKLPHTFLRQFAETLHHPYNEDHLMALLRALKLRTLMGRLLQIMVETAQLTEGFMPMPPIDDRITEKIRKTIV